jgi:phage-related protein
MTLLSRTPSQLQNSRRKEVHEMALLGSYKFAFSPDMKAFVGAGRQAASDFNAELGAGLQKTDAFGSKLLGGAGFVAKGAIGAVGAATTGLVALGGAAISAQADIQQSLGGVEAVFQDNAGVLKNWAGAAAGTMGMSTNAALEMANKMGSLFQGSGATLDQATEMTMKMSQRAADVASVMGVDLPTAMEAVTGAAKGNFTMMDNLGVAMNEGSLAAYALSAGYKTAYKDMSSAEKSGVAYAMFMDKTSQYAGNFAKENSSLAGSMDILKSSWGNVMSSLGDPQMLDGAMKQLSTAVTGAFDALLKVLPSIITGLVTVISDGLPMLLETVTKLIPQLVKLIQEALPSLITAIVDALPGLIEGLGQALVALSPVLISAILQLLVGIVKVLPLLVDQILAVVIALLPELVTAVIQLVSAIIDAVPLVIAALVAVLPELLQAIFIALVALIPELLVAAVELFMALVTGLGMVIVPLVLALAEVFAALWNGITAWSASLDAKALEVFNGFIASAGLALSGLWGSIRNWFDEIPGRISEAFGDMSFIGARIVEGIWRGIVSRFNWLTDNVKSFGSDIVGTFTDFFQIHSPSRLMEDKVGNFIGEGIGTGIADSAKTVMRDAARFSAQVSSGFDIHGEVDYGNSAFASTAGVVNNTTVYQEIQKPDDMLDIFLATKRGARAGFVGA